MLTEAEAREKMCPYLASSDNANWGATRCAAGLCMAWRWGKAPMITRRIYIDSPENGDLYAARKSAGSSHFFAYDGATWRYEFNSSDSRGEFIQIVRSPDEDEAAPTHGYCGAFGKPGEG